MCVSMLVYGTYWYDNHKQSFINNCTLCDQRYNFTDKSCDMDRQILCPMCYPYLTRGPVPFAGNTYGDLKYLDLSKEYDDIDILVVQK